MLSSRTRVLALSAMAAMIGCEKVGAGSAAPAAKTDMETETETGTDDTNTSTSEESTDNTTSAGVSVGTFAKDSEVAVSGVLSAQVAGLRLTDKVYKVAAFKLGGRTVSADEVIVADVGENGGFSLSLPKMSAGGFPLALEEDGEDGGESEPKPASYALVKYEVSATGDRVAEANSFVFIGMANGSAFMNSFPIGQAKGDFALGPITVDADAADQAIADLDLATLDVFTVSSGTLAKMTSINDAIKTLKNVWMNQDASIKTDFTMSYFWAGSKSAATIAEAQAPVDYLYVGTGLYLGISGDAVTLDKICSHAMVMKFYPPEDVGLGNFNMTVGPTNPLDTTNLAAAAASGGRLGCQSMGYPISVQEVWRGASGGNGGIGSVTTSWGSNKFEKISQGLYKLEVDGTAVGHYEMASSSPFDADGRARIFFPSIKLAATAGTLSGAEVGILAWDSANAEYVMLDDLTLFDSLLGELIIVFQSGATMQSVNLRTKLVGAKYIVAATDLTNSFAVSALSASVSYVMFGNSYQAHLTVQ